jgi:hypothetical protein
MSDFWKSLQSDGYNRPTTASSRPGTSGGRRHLTSSAVASSSFVPVVLDQPSSSSSVGSGVDYDNSNGIAINNKELLLREADRDDLLRIMNQDKHIAENEALLAAEQGDIDGIKRLISSGLNLMCSGFNGYSLLHQAASRGHCKVIAELIRHRVIPIDIQNDAGETPLHLAVYGGHLLAVDQLLDYGASINVVNKDNETCLFYAARKSTAVIVRLLIQRGVDVNIKDNYDEFAIDHATNPLVVKAFHVNKIAGKQVLHDDTIKITYDDLLRIFSYLDVNDVLRSACVCSKWHRVAENDGIWKILGIRRWELALQSKLGFAPTTTASFLSRPRSKSSAGGTNSSTTLSRNNSGRITPSSSLVSRMSNY